MRRPDEIIDRVQTWGGAIELSTAQNRALLDYIAALETMIADTVGVVDVMNVPGGGTLLKDVRTAVEERRGNDAKSS